MRSDFSLNYIVIDMGWGSLFKVQDKKKIRNDVLLFSGLFTVYFFYRAERYGNV